MGKEPQYENVHEAEGGEIGRPFFSIIVPAYNAERYLPDIIRCITDQSFKDYEAIIIDDGSKDGTLNYLNSLSEKRIRYIHKEVNEGLSAARNTGMTAAKGKYILFWDADDRTDNNLLEKLKEILSKKECDLVIYGTKELYYNSRGKEIYRKEIIPDSFLSEIPYDIHCEAVKLESQTLLGYAWNKCYRLDFLRENRFEFKKIKLIEDIDFNIEVFDRLKSLYVMNYAPYEYMKRNSESLTEGYIEGYFELNSERIRKLMEYYKKWGCYEPEGVGNLSRTYSRYIYSHLLRIYKKSSNIEFKVELENIFRTQLYKQLILNSKLKNNGLRTIMFNVLKRKNINAIKAIVFCIFLSKKYLKKSFLFLSK